MIRIIIVVLLVSGCSVDSSGMSAKECLQFVNEVEGGLDWEEEDE